MDNRAVEVVNHELEDRLDVLLGVAGVVGKGGVPVTTVEHSAGKVHSRSGDLAGRVLEEAVVETADFKKVLSESTRLDVVVVGLGDTAEEVHGVRVGEVVVEGGQDETLGLEDLGLGEAIIGNVLEVLDVRRQDLLVLGSNEHGGNTNELKTVKLDNLAREETVDDVDSKEQSLGQEPEAGVNLQQPVDEDATHLPLKLVLAVHVVWVGQGSDLELLHVVEDLVHILGNHERVVEVLRVEVLGLLGKLLQSLVVKLVVVQSKVLGSEGGLLLNGRAVLGGRYVLGNLFLNVDDGVRLGSRSVALLDDRAANTRAARRPLEVGGCIVRGLGAKGGAGSGSCCGTRSRLLDAGRLRTLRSQCGLTSSTLLCVRSLGRLVLCNIAHISKGSAFAGCAVGRGGGCALGGSQGLLGRVAGSGLKCCSFGARQARGADILGVLVSDTAAGNSRLEETCQQHVGGSNFA